MRITTAVKDLLENPWPSGDIKEQVEFWDENYAHDTSTGSGDDREDYLSQRARILELADAIRAIDAEKATANTREGDIRQEERERAAEIVMSNWVLDHLAKRILEDD